MEHIVEYVRYLVERGEPVALKKKEAAELLAVFESYEAAQRRIVELEAEVAETEADMAEITRKYMELVKEEILYDKRAMHLVAGETDG